MSGRIPREFIDDLLTRVDIVDVIGRRIPLKKKGKDYWACCPFHGEKTPSFSISQPKQFYKCFGCGVAGNVVSFVMEYDHCDFVTAIETIAGVAGIEVPREAGSDPQAALRTDLYQLLAEVSGFYQQQLREESATNAVEYLKKRGVSGDVVKKYAIGYSSQAWDKVLNKFGGSEKQRELLIMAGLLSRKEGGKTYDFFRDRVMFPVRDARGRTIAFGGRTIQASDSGPKYLNSPETPVFQKGHELYGLFEAKQERHALNERVILVEGYMDVVALAQYGIHNAVAALGTAATKMHLETLFKICPEIVCCFDGDKAGRGAAWRALQHALPLQREGKQVKFLFLPDNEDPDSLVRQIGKDAFEQKLKTESLSLSQYLFDDLSRQTDLRTVDGRARLAALVQPLLAQVEDQIFKALLEQELQQRIGLQPSSPVSAPRIQRSKIPPRKNAPLSLTPLRTLVAVLMQQPLWYREISIDDLQDWQHSNDGQLLHDVCAFLHEHPDSNLGRLLLAFDQHSQLPLLQQLAAWEHHLLLADGSNDEAALQQVFQETADKLRAEVRMERGLNQIRDLENKLKAGTATADEKSMLVNLLSRKQ